MEELIVTKVKVSELKKGDEIIIGSNGKLMRLKLLKDPVLDKQSTNRYRTLRCSTRLTITQEVGNFRGRSYSYTSKNYSLGDEEHNHVGYYAVNGKDILLIKKQ